MGSQGGLSWERAIPNAYTPLQYLPLQYPPLALCAGLQLAGLSSRGLTALPSHRREVKQ